MKEEMIRKMSFVQTAGEQAGWVCKASSGCGIVAWLLHYLGTYQSQILAICGIISTIIAIWSFISDQLHKRKGKK